MIVREIGRAYAQAIPGLEILMLRYSTVRLVGRGTKVARRLTGVVRGLPGRLPGEIFAHQTLDHIDHTLFQTKNPFTTFF